jgi:hypothetical protein
MHAFVFFFNFVNLFQFILPYKLLATSASNNFFGEKFWRIFKAKNLLLAESSGFGHFLASDCSTSHGCKQLTDLNLERDWIDLLTNASVNVLSQSHPNLNLTYFPGPPEDT